MTYSKGTHLRYYPSESANHYTAVISANGLFQVKPTHKLFPSLSEWLASLPGQPTEDKLEVNEKSQSPKWKKLQSRSKQTWPAYLYTVITRSNRALKKNTELCEAFNRLVEVLDGLPKVHVLISPIRRRGKGYDHVLFKEPHPTYPQEKWDLLPVQYAHFDKCRFAYIWHVSLEERKTFVPAIYEAYQALYDLMEKHGVIRYVREVNQQVELWSLRNELYRNERTLNSLVYKRENLQRRENVQRACVEKLREKIAGYNNQ